MTALDIRRVDHLSYTVGNIDRSVEFYAKFGFAPASDLLMERPPAG